MLKTLHQGKSACEMYLCDTNFTPSSLSAYHLSLPSQPLSSGCVKLQMWETNPFSLLLVKIMPQRLIKPCVNRMNSNCRAVKMRTNRLQAMPCVMTQTAEWGVRRVI